MSDIQNLEIDLDLKQNILVTVNCKEFDDLVLKFNIWNNGLQADLSNYRCRLKALKQDQIPLVQNTDITISGNIVNVVANEQLTTTSGMVITELQFIDKTTGEKKSTFNLNIKVFASVMEVDRTISKATITLLEELDNKLDEIEDIGDVLNEAKTVKASLESDITTVNTLKSNLDGSINTASSTKTALDTSNTNALSTKNALDSSVTNGNNSKAALDTATTNAETKKQEVISECVIADNKISAMQAFGDVTQVSQDITNLKSELQTARNGEVNLDTRLDKMDTNIANNTTDLSDITQYIIDKTKGDGVIDATSHIQDILTSASGNTVIIPKGNYKITSSLNIPTNTTIIAYGARIFNTTTQQTILNLSSGVKIFGLEIEGAGNSIADSNGIGISIVGNDVNNYKTNIAIRDCYIHNIGFYGIYTSFLKDSYIENNRIENVGYAGVMNLSVINVHIDKNKIKGILPGQNSNAYGIAFTRASVLSLTTNPRSKDCSANFNTIEDNTIWEALDTHAGDNIEFIGNTINNCKTGIAIVGANISGLGTDYAPIGCRVSGNKINGISTGAGIIVSGAGNTLGSPYEYAIGCIVQGNQLYKCGAQGNANSAGILCTDTESVSITGNTLYQCYANGVNMYNGNKGFCVTGNTAIDIQDSTYTEVPAFACRSDYNTGVFSGNTSLLTNASINIYVGVTGIRIETSSSHNDIVVGVNYSTCTYQQANLKGNLVSFGNFNGAKLFSYTATPEGIITAPMGSLCVSTNGGTSTTLYVKTSGTGNTGWTAK
jgi:hypothetical protein